MDDSQPPPPPAPDDLPAPPRGGRVVAIVVGVIVAVALAGGVGAFLLVRGSGEQLLDRVPADTDVVVTIYLDPAASQKLNLLRMADEIPALGSGGEITGQLDRAIDEALSVTGLTHNDLDWIGSQVAISVDIPDSGPLDVEVAALIATDDESSATETLARLRADGSPIGDWRQEDRGGIEVWVGSDGSEQTAYALVDGVVVLSNSVDAIDDVVAASRGEVDTLAASASYQDATADLPEGKLALVYANPTELSAAIANLPPTVFGPSIETSSQSLEGITGMAMSVSAEQDGMAVDVQVTFDPEALTESTREALVSSSRPNPLLEGIPADALAVLSQDGLRESFEGFIEQVRELSPETATSFGDDLVDALTGDLAIAAMPTGATDVLSGVVMIGTTDESAMSDSIRALLADVLLGARKWKTTDHGGVDVVSLVDRTNTTPYAFSYAVFDGAAVLGVSPEAVFAVIDARQSGSSITEATAYRRCDGGGAERDRFRLRRHRWARRHDPGPASTRPDRRLRCLGGRDDGSPRRVRHGHGVDGHQHASADVPARGLRFAVRSLLEVTLASGHDRRTPSVRSRS